MTHNPVIPKNLKLPITYDIETNTIVVSNVNPLPLTIKISGPICISFDDDVLLEGNGQFDILTNDNQICLDSLNSQIYLNSRRCKKIIGDEHPDIQLSHQKCKPTVDIDGLKKLCENMNNRIVLLEQNFGETNGN